MDDHPLFRDALDMALRQAVPDGCSAEHCASLEAAMDSIAGRRPDFILLDLNLGDSSGFDGLVRVQTVDATLPVAVISATETRETYRRARALGAKGYLPKSLSLDTLTTALKAVLDGGEWFPVDIDEEAEGDGADAELAERLASLTPAQRRVLEGLSEGLLNKQIAYDMGISEATVKAHMTAIFRKLGVNNRTQALLTLKAVTTVDDHSAA